MNDKEKIRAEVLRLKKLVDDPILSYNDLMLGERNAYNVVLKFIDSLPEEPYDSIIWLKGALWNDVNEVPKFTEGDNTANQIIVFGETRAGKGCAIGSMVSEGMLYAPVTGMEYKWGDCPFVKWAYVKDILTDEMIH